MDNHGKRWNDDDIRYIFSEIRKNKCDINIIAEKLKRTPLAVNSKLYQIINLLINIIGIDINTISQLNELSDLIKKIE